MSTSPESFLTVLLVEDEQAIRRFVRAALEGVGCRVHEADSLHRGLLEAGTRQPDLIILDLGLPGRPGLEVLREWRGKGSHIPVLILTARSSWAERIEGLKAGADDYLSKPFHPEELLLRIQALLRRANGLSNQPELMVGGLQLDEAQQRVTLNGQCVELTAAEFRLLRYFMLHSGQLLSKSQLSDHLYDGESERDSNVLEVLVNRLRGKFGKTVIETRRGQGYRFVGVH